MADIDAAVGRPGQPPAVEYLFCDAYSKVSARATGCRAAMRRVVESWTNLGHACVRYTLPSTGEQIVMSELPFFVGCGT